MRNKKVVYVVVIVLCLVVSCTKKGTFAVELEDLNGTWQPDWSYKAIAKLSDDERHYSNWEFSWGMGITIPNTTFSIDLGADEPSFFATGIREFYVREVRKTGRDTITVKASSKKMDELGEEWLLTVVFHFIDKDRIWIESDDFNGRGYGKGAVWYRLSGPQ